MATNHNDTTQPDSVAITVKFPADVREQLDAMAKSEDLTLSQIVRRGVVAYLAWADTHNTSEG